MSKSISRHLYQYYRRLCGSLFVYCGGVVSTIFLCSLILGDNVPSKFINRPLPPPTLEVLLRTGSFEQLTLIFKKNYWCLLLECIGVFTAGFTSILQVAGNGFQAGLLVRNYQLRTLLCLVVPHAIIEFTAILLGATISLWLVIRTCIDALNHEYNFIGKNLKNFLLYEILCVCLIFIAGIVEVYVTPHIGAYFLYK